MIIIYIELNRDLKLTDAVSREWFHIIMKYGDSSCIVYALKLMTTKAQQMRCATVISGICTIHVRITKCYFVIPQFVHLPRHTIRYSRWVFRGPQVLNIQQSAYTFWQMIGVFISRIIILAAFRDLCRNMSKLPRLRDVCIMCMINW